MMQRYLQFTIVAGHTPILKELTIQFWRMGAIPSTTSSALNARRLWSSSMFELEASPVAPSPRQAKLKGESEGQGWLIQIPEQFLTSWLLTLSISTWLLKYRRDTRTSCWIAETVCMITLWSSPREKRNATFCWLVDAYFIKVMCFTSALRKRFR